MISGDTEIDHDQVTVKNVIIIDLCKGDLTQVIMKKQIGLKSNRPIQTRMNLGQNHTD